MGFRMRGLLLWPWQQVLLGFLGCLLCTDLCRAQRLVEMPVGPLYRVKGFPMSLSCSVSGFKGSAWQEFAFSLFKPEAPELEIQIIHTADQNYAYAMFSGRVRNKDIMIERLSGSSVVLHISSLHANDAGTYECYTPNTDGTFFGTYNARTTVNVIEDTLVALYSGPASHSMSEGASLQLECQVSSQTFQHTHVSVTWHVHGPTQNSTIITLDRDLTVRPGSAFEQRYRAGLVSMEKVDDTTYRLRMSEVQPADSGEIFCQADEWILDPDRSWMRIAYRNTTGSSVRVEALAVAPDTDSFISHVELVSGNVEEGGRLAIRCRVEARNLKTRFFSVTWLKEKHEVAQIGPTGVLTVFGDYAGRHSDRELRVVKVSEDVLTLTIQPVRTGDQGGYQCRASAEERTDSGLFSRGRSEVSREESVLITPKESSLAVFVTPPLVQVTEGEMLQITCRVSGVRGPTSVSWKHKKASGSAFDDVVRLSAEGVMEPTPLYQQRGVRVFRPNSTDFTLEVAGAVLSDSGEYMCTVTENAGDMSKANSNSQQAAVSVRSIDSLLQVVLKSRDTNVVENSSVKMICSVSAPQVPLAVTWKFQPQNSQAQRDIACVGHTGTMSCRGEQRDYWLETQRHGSNTLFILKVLRARRRLQGRYQCQVDAYLNDLQRAEKVSNQLGINVHRPESTMSVFTKPKSRLETSVSSNVKVDCLITSPTFNSSRFGVAWMNGDLTLLKMDHEGVLSLGPATQDMEQRVGLTMIGRHSFQLTVQQVRSTDRGLYRCLVEEWVQDPDDIWYQLQEKNVTMELVVTEKGSDFSLDKRDTSLSVPEEEVLTLACLLKTAGLDSIFQYSVSWFFERHDQKSPTIELLTYTHDGRLIFHDSELRNRLQFFRPEVRSFQLSILRSVASDSGRYYCQAHAYERGGDGKGVLKASDKSGISNVIVTLTENKLQVKKASESLNITDPQGGVTVECEISSRSSDRSMFEVTWSRRRGGEQPLQIFTASRDGTLHSGMRDRKLVFDRPSLSIYTLTVPVSDSSDSGQYRCEVQEWIQTTTNTWRKVAEDTSGELSVRVESEDKPSTGTFILKESLDHLNITEGKHFDLSCSIIVDKWDPTVQYTLTWYVERQDSKSRSFLLTQTFHGHLEYQSENQQLKSRLQFSRPTGERFHLSVLSSVPADSGRYVCKVEQYQLADGQWQKSGLPQWRSILVTVNSTENKLQVKKASESLNITDPQGGVTVECEISSRSSDRSVFEVTWSRRRGGEQPLQIFTASRDGTLHSGMRDRKLVFDRPSLSIYTLTVPVSDPSDSGQYRCEVQEWIQTTTNTWRKVAEDTSGELSVHVQPSDLLASASEAHSSGIMLGIGLPIIVILFIVVVLLVREVKKTSASKNKETFWPENNPLKTITDAATDEEHSAS
ncbi:immunoglobulin superfamily member 3 isoform X1 [Electrophorus electricus]|uniref:immunoglobulin superfamily member 3 isoform X1 n=1 Tax=Electrophorus electricus TaxID=8005 RepID=UPI0015CFCA3F|nr:immunoglobulin superfamily member 3 isoform X1 [Electrophorus electricus]